MRKENLWRIFAAAALTLLLLAAGCAKEQQKEQPTAGQIAEKLAEQAAAQGMGSAADYMEVFYSQLDLEKLAEYEVLSPMMNVKASEIAVFRVKEEEDAEAVRQAAEQRAQDVQASFQHYLEDQYEIAQKAQVLVKDDLICLIIDENAEQLAETFEQIA